MKTETRCGVLAAYVPFALLCLAISIVSHLSDPPLQRVLEIRFMDKVLHASAYVGVGGAAFFAVARRRGRLDRAGWFEAVLMAALHGMADEVHQWFVPRRFASVSDAAADAAGAMLGAWLCWRLLRSFQRRRARSPSA